MIDETLQQIEAQNSMKEANHALIELRHEWNVMAHMLGYETIDDPNGFYDFVGNKITADRVRANKAELTLKNNANKLRQLCAKIQMADSWMSKEKILETLQELIGD